MKSTAIAILIALSVSSCEEADVASMNATTASHSFESIQRCSFYNSITDSYFLTIEGNLSIRERDNKNRLEVIVKTGPEQYKQFYFGLSDNVFYIIEPLEPIEADPYHFQITHQ